MMRKGLLTIMVVIMILIIGVYSQAGHAADWTFMVYLDGDNDLESRGIEDFLEMATVGSYANINIIVQFDRIPGYSSAYDDWVTCKRFRITSGMTPTAANALDDLGECNMGDPATLTDFINWATRNYPASNYAVILWNHGLGWRQRQEALLKALEKAETGAEKAAIEKELEEIKRPDPIKAVCWDDTNDDRLYMKEVKNALNNATTDMDLVGFDACLMGMIEVAHEIKDTGGAVMVGSEDIEPGSGWPYDTILSGLKSNPSWTPSQLGSWIVDKYYQWYGNSTKTQSAIDLTKSDALANAVTNFANAMRSSWNTNVAAVQSAAQAVINQINTAVINERHGAGWPGAHGLAIYFPKTPGEFDPDYNSTIIDFPADTTWEEFLSDYYASMGGSWISIARGASQEFWKVQHVDLYDFCEKIVAGPQQFEYQVSEIPYNFEDISATGTGLNLSDDGYKHFSIPFTFQFCRVDYNAVTVSANGIIYFINDFLGYINKPIPSDTRYGINTYIAPFWDDLNPPAGGNVYYEVKGSAPNRRLIVQWHQVPHMYNIGAATFQAVLYEGSKNIEFHYLDVAFEDPKYDYGASATVGIQKNSTTGLEYSYNSPSLGNELGLRFNQLGGGSITPILLLLLGD